jgi:hypothetical protein
MSEEDGTISANQYVEELKSQITDLEIKHKAQDRVINQLLKLLDNEDVSDNDYGIFNHSNDTQKEEKGRKEEKEEIASLRKK